jgi:HD-GYP domain-containing protein (c-di-GMP phosphodiesterase class II)
MSHEIPGQTCASIDMDQSPPGRDCEGYLPIALDTLCPVPVLNFDIYIRPEGAAGPVLYRERNYPLGSDELQRLVREGVRTLYIPLDAQKAFRRYLFDMVVKNVGVDPRQRYQALIRATRAAFNAAFRSISPNHMVEFAEEFGAQMVEIVCQGELLLFDFLSLMQHDYYTYTHSVNVCTCTVALANMLWDDPNADLKPIAAGSVMHDIGKRRIPRYVIRKRGALSEEERELMRQHPTIGFEEICMRQDVTWGGLMSVYQHHERIDGSGYPARFVGGEIHEWARICAVADVFDALRSDRPYRKGWRVQHVLEYLESRAGREFDKEMVRCWNSAIKSKS